MRRFILYYIASIHSIIKVLSDNLSHRIEVDIKVVERMFDDDLHLMVLFLL